MLVKGSLIVYFSHGVLEITKIVEISFIYIINNSLVWLFFFLFILFCFSSFLFNRYGKQHPGEKKNSYDGLDEEDWVC